jgi:hypothetical protein
MISPAHTVGKNSPPRYFISGADSDDDEQEEIEHEQVVRLANQVATSTLGTHNIFIDISFKNPKEATWIKQRIISPASCEYEGSPKTFKITFVIPQEKPVFFLYKYTGLWSKISVWYSGDFAKNGPLLLQKHRSYIPLNSQTNELTSIDLLATLDLANLSDPERASLGLVTSKCRRVLFIEGDDSISRTIRQNRIELGSILAVKKIVIKIPVE